MAVYNVHGGHSLTCRGASGLLDEVSEDRKVKDKVIFLLRKAGHTVYDCTDDYGKTQNQNLVNIVSKCNAHKVDLDISIHLNAGGGTGCEVENYDSKTKTISDRICANISSALGIKNRGTKYMQDLYVLRNTKAPAILVECCFVDNATDKAKWNVEKCAKAIVEGILNCAVQDTQSSGKNSTASQPSTSGKTQPVSSGKINVAYQAFTEGKWLSEITNWNSQNSNGYAGILGKGITALRAKTKGDAKTAGYLECRAHAKGGKWFEWRRDYNKDSSGDTYAGDGKTKIDGLQFRIVGASGKNVKYRVHCIGKGWLGWVTNHDDTSNGYAGWYGYEIDAVQIEIV